MLTKREIYQATGISGSTFLHWRRLGLVPAPCGIRKREATFPDSIISRINYILKLQNDGQSLLNIKKKIEIESKILEDSYNDQIQIFNCEKKFEIELSNHLNIQSPLHIQHINFNDVVSCLVFTEKSVIIALINIQNENLSDNILVEKLNYDEFGLFVGAMQHKMVTEENFSPVDIAILTALYTDNIDNIANLINLAKKKYSIIKFAETIINNSTLLK